MFWFLSPDISNKLKKNKRKFFDAYLVFYHYFQRSIGLYDQMNVSFHKTVT